MNYIIIETTVSSAVKTKHGYKLKTKEGKYYLRFRYLNGRKIKPGDKVAIYLDLFKSIKGVMLNGKWLFNKTEKRNRISRWQVNSLLALDAPRTDDRWPDWPFTLPLG